MHVLTKLLRDGKTRLSIDIEPYGSPDSSAMQLVLSRDGREWTRTREHPRRLDKPPAPGVTHALPVDDGRQGGQAIGLTAAEAKTVEDAIRAHRERQDQRQKDRIRAARLEAEARARAAAPGAPVFTVRDPWGHPAGIGGTARLDDGRAVTVLRTWTRYYREDGMSFGAADDAGHVYLTEVREATPGEEAALREREQRAARREELQDRASALWREPDATCPDDTAGLDGLPAVRTAPERQHASGAREYRHLRLDEPGGWLWLIVYNGADGDDWSQSNYRASIARRLPLTPGRAALAADLRAEFGVIGD